MASGGEQSEGETQRDNAAAEPRQCQLCGKIFKVTKSLKWHYIKQHGEAENSELVASIPKSPKKPCQRCGKAVSNPWAHKRSCPGNKAAVAGTTSGEESPTKASGPSTSERSTSQSQRPEPEAEAEAEAAPPSFVIRSGHRMSNAEMVQLYQRWMASTRGRQASEKTIDDYTRHLKEFISLQTRDKPGFLARHWVGFNSNHFTPLASVGDWIPRGDSQPTANKKICAFKHLVNLIRANLVAKGGGCVDFAQRGAHLEERHRDASELARRWRAGDFAAAAAERTSSQQKKEKGTIDVVGWRRLMKAYTRSDRRVEALNSFMSECYFYYYYYY